MHEKEGTILTASDCYKPEYQVIARQRSKPTSTKKWKAHLAKP